jgi:hypothetical protein
MASELYIEDKLVDLPTDADISIEYAIAKIGEIEKRSGVRSAEFTIPKTAKNKAIFENPDDVNNIGTKPYRRLKARYYSNGIDQQISFATLKESAQGYNVNIYGGNSDFFAALKDNSIRDLDLNEYNHHWDIDYVNLSKPQDYPIKYALVDYQTDSPNTGMNNTDSRAYLGVILPCIYEEFLIEQIVLQKGYTINNETKLEPIFQSGKMALPIGGDEYQRDTDLSRLKGVFQLGTIPTGQPAGNFYNAASITSQEQSYWQQYFNSNSNFGGAFVIPDECKITYKLDINLYNFGASAEFIYIDVYSTDTIAGSALIRTYSINVPVTGYPPTTPINFTVTDDVTCVIPTVGYCSFSFVVRSASGSNVFNQVGDNYFEILDAELLLDNRGRLIEYVRDIEFENSGIYVYNYVTVASNLPDFSQSDYFKSYIQKTCSLVFVDEINKVVNIYPFKKVLDSIALAKDWSNKLDFTDVPQITYTLDYSQRNILMYADDDDVIKPSGTDYTILIDDENLEYEQTLVELPFSATEMIERLNGVNICKINRFTANAFDVNFQPRSIFITFGSGSFRYRFAVGSDLGSVVFTTDIPYTHFIDINKDYSLGFERDLYFDLWQFIGGVIDRTKIVTCLLRLNASDINQLDLTIPVYIEYFNSYFYVSKISGYNPNRNVSTLVELVKLY